MGQESKTIKPTQEEIDNAVKSAEEQMRSFKESEKKIKSEDKEMWRKLEEQMASPEGLEGIGVSARKKQMTEEKETEIKQAFLRELNKWDDDYLSAVPDTRDLPLYLDPDAEIINRNSFEIPPLFVDYLIAFLTEKIGKEKLIEKLKGGKITFLDIVGTDDLELVLRNEDSTTHAIFENKYPFKLLKYWTEFLK